MALVGKVTDPVSIPHEPGQWFQFRELSSKQLDEAELAQTRRAFDVIKGIDPQALAAATASMVPSASISDPREAFDKDTLCKYGIAAWSYEDACTPANIEQLDRKTRDWASAQVVNLVVRDQGEETASARQPLSLAEFPAS